MLKKIRLITIVLTVLLMSTILGCSKLDSKKDIPSTKESNDSMDMSIIENDIPYTSEFKDKIDNSIIEKRYENVNNVNKEDLSYDTLSKTKEYDNEDSITEIELADSIKDDINYCDILLGFTYYSEINPSRLTYNEAITLVKKVLPDDIEKVKTVLDNEVNKEYIYYKSSKGNFRVGLCYGYVLNEEGAEEVDKNLIVGIDYSREIE